MNEMIVSVEQTNGILNISNYDEIKANVQASMELYKTMVFTEDTLIEAKSTVATLRKFFNMTDNLQNEVTTAQKDAEQARIELAATQVAMTLGINAKTVQYVLKMADFSKAKGTDGKISEDNVKAAIEQVLKDVPALKPSTENNEGFQIGAGQQTNGQQSSAGSNVNVPTKRWNRFN